MEMKDIMSICENYQNIDVKIKVKNSKVNQFRKILASTSQNIKSVQEYRGLFNRTFVITVFYDGRLHLYNGILESGIGEIIIQPINSLNEIMLEKLRRVSNQTSLFIDIDDVVSITPCITSNSKTVTTLVSLWDLNHLSPTDSYERKVQVWTEFARKFTDELAKYNPILKYPEKPPIAEKSDSPSLEISVEASIEISNEGDKELEEIATKNNITNFSFDASLSLEEKKAIMEQAVKDGYLPTVDVVKPPKTRAKKTPKKV